MTTTQKTSLTYPLTVETVLLSKDLPKDDGEEATLYTVTTRQATTQQKPGAGSADSVHPGQAGAQRGGG